MTGRPQREHRLGFSAFIAVSKVALTWPAEVHDLMRGAVTVKLATLDLAALVALEARHHLSP